MFNQFRWFFDHLRPIFNHLSLIFLHGYLILIVFIGTLIIFDAFFRSVTAQVLPLGVPARVAIMTKVPLDEQPYWMSNYRCMAFDCHEKESLMSCSFCSAHICYNHTLLLGRPQRGKNNERLGGGSVRCSDTKNCNHRLERMKYLLHQRCYRSRG